MKGKKLCAIVIDCNVDACNCSKISYYVTMSVYDVWVRDTLSRYGIITVTAVLVIVWVKVKWPKFKQYVYKSYLVGFEAECAELASPYKTKLFSLIEQRQSRDAFLRSVGRIRILEIGVKTGTKLLCSCML